MQATQAIFFNPRQNFMDPRHPFQISTHPTYAIFLTHAKIFWTRATNATHAILADLPQMFVALQLPLYYLEQLHQPAIKN